MNSDKIQGASDAPENTEDEADGSGEAGTPAVEEQRKKVTGNIQVSAGEVEAMIDAKVRSLSKPRSG